MKDKKDILSKCESKFIKRKINRLLHGFDEYNRGQLYNKINCISRAILPNHKWVNTDGNH